MKNLHLGKFKKLTKYDDLFLDGDLASNRFWIFKISWLNSLKIRSTIGLRKAIAKRQLEVVRARLTGAEVRRHDFGTLLKKAFITDSVNPHVSIELTKKTVSKRYAVIESQLQKQVIGFFVKNGAEKVCLDAEYFTALFFDNEVKAYFRSSIDPVFLIKNNEIVGAIAPVNVIKGK
jgi:hypothetical protein